MTPAAFRKHALSLPGTECVEQWGDDQVYKIAGKMFTATDRACTKISFKCSDEAFHVREPALTGHTDQRAEQRAAELEVGRLFQAVSSGGA